MKDSIKKLVKSELIILAEERGFETTTFSTKWTYDALREKNKQFLVNDGCISSLFAEIQKWLREKHRIEVAVVPAYDDIIDLLYTEQQLESFDFFGIQEFANYMSIVNDNRDTSVDDGVDDYVCFHDTYEEVLEKGLVAALKIIK